MTSLGWGAAGLLSLPQLVVFGQNYVTAEGPFQNKTVCESIFRSRPMSHRQAYLTFIGLVVFYVPLVIIMVLYIRIFMKISQKTAEATAASCQAETSLTKLNLSSAEMKCGKVSRSKARPKKVHLQISTMSRSLPRAKVKTFSLTLVIVSSFIVSSLPYHVYELILSFGDHTIVSGAAAAFMGALAIANSVTNPYVFLAFNVNIACVRKIVDSFTSVEKLAGSANNQDMHELRGSSVGTEFTETHGDHLNVENNGANHVRDGVRRVAIINNEFLTVRAAMHAEFHSAK